MSILYSFNVNKSYSSTFLKKKNANTIQKTIFLNELCTNIENNYLIYNYYLMLSYLFCYHKCSNE